MAASVAYAFPDWLGLTHAVEGRFAAQVARLRAEAYYAEDRSRFAESFKRQFASQEVDSLQHRTQRRGGRDGCRRRPSA